MALSSLEQNHVSQLGELSKTLEALYTPGILLQEQWYGTGDFDASITQEEIDAIPSLLEAGVTVNDLTELNYVNAQLLGLLTLQRLAVIVKLARLP